MVGEKGRIVQYIITLLEGVITFVQPCLLPMLPIYLSWFAGGAERDTKRTLLCALGFILGFTLVFIAFGAFAGLVGGLLRRYGTVVNIVAGSIVILFGLNYLGILNIPILNKTRLGSSGRIAISGFFSAVLFGVVFSIGWTPCVGVFLGAALMKAAQQASAVEGVLLLLCFSLGLGIPFLLSAVLIDRLKTAFDWIKRHYRMVNIVSGSFLVVIGVLMMTGMMGRFLAILAV